MAWIYCYLRGFIPREKRKTEPVKAVAHSVTLQNFEMFKMSWNLVQGNLEMLNVSDIVSFYLALISRQSLFT